MGRAFEFRKERKFKRWSSMSKLFTRRAKEITMAAKMGGPDPDYNARLRALISTARSENMPKDNIDRAIKRASEKDQSDYKEVVYEGYGPHGIAFLIETATDNTNRTVANIRSYFTNNGGSLGTSGSVEFLFEHKCSFKAKAGEGVKLEGEELDQLELDSIDAGVDEFVLDNEELNLYGPFEAYGAIQKFVEESGLELLSAEFERIPINELTILTKAEKEEVEKLIERLENDEDVQAVHHTMAEKEKD